MSRNYCHRWWGNGLTWSQTQTWAHSGNCFILTELRSNQIDNKKREIVVSEMRECSQGQGSIKTGIVLLFESFESQFHFTRCNLYPQSSTTQHLHYVLCIPIYVYMCWQVSWVAQAWHVCIWSWLYEFWERLFLHCPEAASDQDGLHCCTLGPRNIPITCQHLSGTLLGSAYVYIHVGWSSMYYHLHHPMCSSLYKPRQVFLVTDYRF